MKARVASWLDSDLVGIPATLYTFAVLAVSLAVFRFGGPVAGIVVAIALWVPMVVFAIRGWGRAPVELAIPRPVPGRHRVLVVADRGLEHEDLCATICRRGERHPAEAFVLAPVGAGSTLRELTDDIDPELSAARRRVEGAIGALRDEGVSSTGRADIADPVEALLDGLREFAPNEVLLVPGSESGWGETAPLIQRVEAEAGVPVTVLGARATVREA